ncbi:MAG: hypothetical protein EA366_03645 [Spirulina sp. DLM2.Bin59]|nr:MAG: hypothetical protein EA366_03645 [Spirulina sp. DLM2.Bin59]
MKSTLMRWKLLLLQGLELSSEQQQQLVQAIQHLADDPGLRLKAFEVEGGDRPAFTFQGGSIGYQRIRTLFKTQQLTNILNLPIKDVSPLETTPPNPSPVIPQLQPNRPAENLATVLYEHFAQLVATESPEIVLNHFQHLLIDTHNIQDMQLQAALEQVVLAKDAPAKFPQILLHCCLLLIHPWQQHKETHPYIAQLLTYFQHLPGAGFKQARGIRRLRELMHEFLTTEQYKILCRLGQIANPVPSNPDRPLGDLIYRYSFLYKNLLLTRESDYEHQRIIQSYDQRAQEYYEFRLNRFVTYQARLAQLAKARQLSQGAGRIIRREKNPTLLGDRELAAALRHFWDKHPGRETRQELAQRLRTDFRRFSSYADFKAQLHQYLITSLPTNSTYPLSMQLKVHLQGILPHYNHRRPDEALSLRTATKLLGLLMVENDAHPDHYLFIEAVANLGASITIGMLIKLTLLCPPLLPELEKRLSHLFRHYQDSLQKDTNWLIKVLENYQLASSIYYGSIDLSPLMQLLKIKPPQPKSEG